MASGWVKSFQCKSRAFEDVYHPNPKHPKNPKNLVPGSSCRKSSQSIKDVIHTATAPQKPKKPKSAPKPEPVPRPSTRIPHFTSSRVTKNPDPFLSELPQGHPSRNVVEIIFHTSWSTKSFSNSFPGSGPGRVEMVFKVQNGARTAARFEEYRELVKSRSGSGTGPGLDPGIPAADEEDSRCVADGNEMMRFMCLGPTFGANGVSDVWLSFAGKGAAICTFSGSGGAHESAGGGRGRRAMLVCRVIAGRVSKRVGFGYETLLDGRVGYDSVSGENGDLLVFDPRAVLPCFLIIYKL